MIDEAQIAAFFSVPDLSESRRVDAVRRDFVANVSHELKTPVGALSLLAEAVQAANDDPDAIKHFAETGKGNTIFLDGSANNYQRTMQQLMSTMQGFGGTNPEKPNDA